MVTRENIELFLSDMSYNTRFEFLEESKQKDELTKIAEKRGIQLPCHDLAVFKGRYAYVDRMNKNKCILPKDEVEKALTTLIGKAVDFDHLRKNVVGYWVDSKIEGDEIIAYGIFFKGNFANEYNDIKKMMTDDVLAISFEAWGNRNFGANGAYSLTDIEFAGGALLIKTQPAFPGSEVLEMSNQGKVLELAKVMTPPATFLHTGDVVKETKLMEQKAKEIAFLEKSKYHMYDIQTIARQLAEVDCLNCEMTGFMDVSSIDFAGNSAQIKCLNCDTEMAVQLTPAATITKKGKKIKEIKENEIPHRSSQTQSSLLDMTEETQNQKEGNTMKKLIEKFQEAAVKAVFQEVALTTLKRELSAEELTLAYSLTDYKAQKRAGTLAETRSLLDLKGKSTSSPTSLLSANILEEDIKEAISEVAKDTEQVNAGKAQEAKVAEETKVAEEVAKVTKELDETKKSLDEANAKLAEIEKAKTDSLIKARRDELTEEFAKDMSDEDILNEDKFTIAKQKKEISLLKKGKTSNVSTVTVDLTKGAVSTEATPEKTSRQKIRELAFGKDESNDEEK